jgi:hypothetical protein
MAVQRLAGNRLKDSMEMERREASDSGERGKRKFSVQVLADVIEHAVDAVFVVIRLPRHWKISLYAGRRAV